MHRAIGCKPTDDNRRLPWRRRKGELGTAGGLYGTGGFFQRSSLAHPRRRLCPGEFLAAKAVSGACLRRRGQGAERAPEKFRSFVAQGVESDHWGS
jgi:hypothetical protein